jgi:hypothetical protein
MPHRLLLNGTDALLLNGTSKLALDGTPIATINQTVPSFTQSFTLLYGFHIVISRTVAAFLQVFKLGPNGVAFSQTVNPFPVNTQTGNFSRAINQKLPPGLMRTGGRPRRAL